MEDICRDILDLYTSVLKQDPDEPELRFPSDSSSEDETSQSSLERMYRIGRELRRANTLPSKREAIDLVDLVEAVDHAFDVFKNMFLPNLDPELSDGFINYAHRTTFPLIGTDVEYRIRVKNVQEYAAGKIIEDVSLFLYDLISDGRDWKVHRSLGRDRHKVRDEERSWRNQVCDDDVYCLKVNAPWTGDLSWRDEIGKENGIVDFYVMIESLSEDDLKELFQQFLKYTKANSTRHDLLFRIQRYMKQRSKPKKPTR